MRKDCSAPLVTAIGLVLIHFLWQGFVVGAFTAAVLRRGTARERTDSLRS